MAKAKKLKSGSWNVVVYDYTDAEGKRHYQSFTADTKAKAEYMAAEFRANKGTQQRKKSQDITVSEAIEKYIELSEVLSPTTIHNYRRMAAQGFQDIMDIKVSKMDNEAMQAAINREAKRIFKSKRISAKTVKNEYGLLSSALKTVCGKSFDVKTPTLQRKVKEYPQPQAVLDAIIGSSVELPCLLAMWLSFSLSEIRGLMCSSIKGDYIYIDQVKVNVDGVDIV